MYFWDISTGYGPLNSKVTDFSLERIILTFKELNEQSTPTTRSQNYSNVQEGIHSHYSLIDTIYLVGDRRLQLLKLSEALSAGEKKSEDLQTCVPLQTVDVQTR